MTSAEIKAKVIGLIHGRDSEGDWILPWEHDKGCLHCDQLAEFIEGLLKDYDKENLKLMEDALLWELAGATDPCKKEETTFKNPLAEDAPLPYLLDAKERNERLRTTGLVCNCSTCKSHRIP
ncbi:hypothetical protein LCGC14_2753970 [marine sediment metagenome]|uniref:Uncharacterized protein n=1 Tax=marine sediment metagenome TaxID=412755 RepID=A0A0F8ZN32_9ZZZZ